MNEKIEIDKELVRQIEADPSKFIEIRDFNGRMNALDSIHASKDKTVVKENNQSSSNRDTDDMDKKSKKDSKHKK